MDESIKEILKLDLGIKFFLLAILFSFPFWIVALYQSRHSLIEKKNLFVCINAIVAASLSHFVLIYWIFLLVILEAYDNKPPLPLLQEAALVALFANVFNMIVANFTFYVMRKKFTNTTYTIKSFLVVALLWSVFTGVISVATLIESLLGKGLSFF